MNAKSTKTAKRPITDTLRAEYHREDLQNGVRGKYFQQHTEGTNLIRLQPEVARAFPTEDAVNQALRGLIEIAKRTTSHA